MSKKYKIWDKQESIYTTAGTLLTPEQWIARNPWINIPGIIPIISGGRFGAAFSSDFDTLKESYEQAGCDFSNCINPQECLDYIDVWEEEQAKEAEKSVLTVDERTANALEDLVMLTELQLLNN